MPSGDGNHRFFHPGDIAGGVTAAVVALPLALAFGVSSGLGPLAGLYGAIICGFFAAVLGGTRVQVSGPTGPMTVVIAMAVAHFADQPAAVFAIIALAGVLQILFGALRLGQYIQLMPQPVISGFLSGVGLIIVIQQLAPLLGSVDNGGTNLARLVALPAQLLNIDGATAALGGLTLAIAFFTPRAIDRYVPAALIAIIVGSLAAHYAFPSSAVIGNIPSGLPSFSLPTFPIHDLGYVIQFALILAFLGMIDSLLTSVVADSITNTKHDSNRELAGQGAGNLLAGLFGGLAGAGATMRTLVNVRAGGRTRMSGAIHSVVLLLIVLGFGDAAAHIPLAVLAGILVKVGIDIIDWPTLRHVTRAPRGETAVMVTTLLITVFVDLITAVAVGFVMSSLLLIRKAAQAQLKNIQISEEPADDDETSADTRIVTFSVQGALSFASARDVANIVEDQTSKDVLLIDLSSVPLIDGTACAALADAAQKVVESGGRVVLYGLRDEVSQMLRRSGALAHIGAGNIFSDRDAALADIRRSPRAQE